MIRTVLAILVAMINATRQETSCVLFAIPQAESVAHSGVAKVGHTGELSSDTGKTGTRCFKHQLCKKRTSDNLIIFF